MDSDKFKLPETTPQDLLLIQDLVGDQLVPPPSEPKTASSLSSSSSDDEDRISSSSNDDDDDAKSEKEILSDLLNTDADAEKRPIPSSDSESDTSSVSDSDSDADDKALHKPSNDRGKDESSHVDAEDDEDETGAALEPGAVPQTKNEVVDADINIPEVEEIGQDETMEKVGEVMSILDNKVVIVKGEPSAIADRGSESALDSDTLLVFDDRKVLGYVYETFGPTSQPFYQVKFNNNYPLDPVRVRTGREVFHVPTRSHFVFVRDIKHLKGSDASNLYDEEPAEHELEFSDDEAEAAAKSRRKRKRGESRAGSVASSRLSTPGPSQMRDQDLSYFSGDAYAEHGPYDIDFTVTSSRPPPMPYDDDPYAEDYSPNSNRGDPPMKPSNSSCDRSHDGEARFASGRSTQWGSDGRIDGRPSRGRGRGRGRGDHSSGGKGRGDFARSTRPRPSHLTSDSPIPETQQSFFPSLPTATWADEQYSDVRVAPQLAYSPSIPDPSAGSWSFHQQYSPNNANFQPYVQPHINPRFASMFGINTNFTPQTPFMVFGQGLGQGTTRTNVGDRRGQASSDWTDEWTVHGGNDAPSG